MVSKDKITVAYRCPTCGSVPTSAVGLISLSGDLFKLKCPCGGSFMTLERISDERFALSVPCVSCSSSHTYYLTDSVLFGDSLVLSCSTCGLDLCFVGTEENVAKAVYESNEEIKRILGDHAITKLKSNECSDLNDPQILDIVTYVISELKEEGNINCGCGKGNGDYECNIYEDFATLRCKKCKKTATIPTDSTIAAFDFLEADEITLS